MKKVAIGIPCNLDNVSTDFFHSLIQMDNFRDCEIIHERNKGQIDELRNKIVEKALESDCSHLLFMDADQIYPCDTITKLCSHDVDIIGGLIHRGYEPYDPLVYKGKLGEYKNASFSENEVIEVDATGTGCLMFNLEIFRIMPKPWFKFEEAKDKTNANILPEFLNNIIGEDIGFCHELRQRGYKIYVDTSIKIIHEKQLQNMKNKMLEATGQKEKNVRSNPYIYSSSYTTMTTSGSGNIVIGSLSPIYNNPLSQTLNQNRIIYNIPTIKDKFLNLFKGVKS